MKTGDMVPAAVLDVPISGNNLGGATLREEMGADPTLFVFLRHFG